MLSSTPFNRNPYLCIIVVVIRAIWILVWRGIHFNAISCRKFIILQRFPSAGQYFAVHSADIFPLSRSIMFLPIQRDFLFCIFIAKLLRSCHSWRARCSGIGIGARKADRRGAWGVEPMQSKDTMDGWGRKRCILAAVRRNLRPRGRIPGRGVVGRRKVWENNLPGGTDSGSG